MTREIHACAVTGCHSSTTPPMPRRISIRDRTSKMTNSNAGTKNRAAPMFISAALFFVPALLFVIFEVRSRIEIRRGIGGVVDEWHPVTAHAWISLVICLVLALVPWLFARRADTVS